MYILNFINNPRDIVKAAHLKPVDRTARASAPASHPWNTATSGGEQPEVREESSVSLVTDVPTNQQEFLRAWRGCAADRIKRYGLLLRLGAEGLEQVFPVESSMQLLGDILVALNEVGHSLLLQVATFRSVILP